MQVRVQKWGNSLALRIPKPFAVDAGVAEGTVVDVSVSEGRLVATPVRVPKVRLRELLSKVTAANLHREIDTGSPVGREGW
jgi:antitoxin MazE